MSGVRGRSLSKLLGKSAIALVSLAIALLVARRFLPLELRDRLHRVRPAWSYFDERMSRVAFPQLFPEEASGSFLLDSLSGVAPRPNLDVKWKWPEHEQGGHYMHNNSRGFRNEREAGDIRPDRRILVLGDSHTQGICSANKTFASVLDAATQRRAGGGHR